MSLSRSTGILTRTEGGRHPAEETRMPWMRKGDGHETPAQDSVGQVNSCMGDGPVYRVRKWHFGQDGGVLWGSPGACGWAIFISSLRAGAGAGPGRRERGRANLLCAAAPRGQSS
ncbi:hypothetical protein MPTK1_1g08700 [Marchantia polymorpha subsp. ruderalis]|uniref:Uncharacterized protein n=2 Tax=Marchantia polymorpha TaxID=3197 RepID=A0AAF6AN12_MARPO|nr:hypothetical protein MARPO_0036s0113 [Marchantia polymorpha]BBM97832.1 hypothetical protein Mp_1g08700 [Marchantia polymorpha subsp. ruderalis]|eukprot:PTQ41135.1 hypothetical protein MARPO_0036s0113 [Marchantia polymorpha]